MSEVETMKTDVREVYRQDSQDCVIFKTEELARNQTIISHVDVVCPAIVDLTDSELCELEERGFLL